MSNLNQIRSKCKEIYDKIMLSGSKITGVSLKVQLDALSKLDPPFSFDTYFENCDAFHSRKKDFSKSALYVLEEFFKFLERLIGKKMMEILESPFVIQKISGTNYYFSPNNEDGKELRACLHWLNLPLEMLGLKLSRGNQSLCWYLSHNSTNKETIKRVLKNSYPHKIGKSIKKIKVLRKNVFFLKFTGENHKMHIEYKELEDECKVEVLKETNKRERGRKDLAKASPPNERISTLLSKAKELAIQSIGKKVPNKKKKKKRKREKELKKSSKKQKKEKKSSNFSIWNTTLENFTTELEMIFNGFDESEKNIAKNEFNSNPFIQKLKK